MGDGGPAAPDTKLSGALMGIPDGPEGVRATLSIMRRLVRQNRFVPEVRAVALAATRSVAAKDFAGEARALFEWVRSNIKYVMDPNGVEQLQTPQATLTLKTGDCDDQSTLLATLLESMGHPTRFVAVAFEPDNFVHVYTQTRIGAAWISADTTEPNEFGWEPPDVLSRIIIN